VARGKQRVQFDEDISEGLAHYRLASNELFGDFLPIFDIDQGFLLEEIIKSDSHVRKFELPANINLLTLDPIINDNDGERI
jgi:hypothetical protein